MLHPVGPQSPSVYWRRRLLALATVALVVVLLVLTARAVFGGDGGSATAGGPHTPAAPPATLSSTAAGHTTPAPTGSTVTHSASASTSAATRSSTAGSSAPPPARCTPAQLAVQAVVGKPSYAVGDNPVLTLQVTNTGGRPCVQDVADSQIVLRVYNGASRVWGSHDCKIEPGVQDRTLEPGKPAGFSIVWSGLTAQPGCTGTRQRVGAGTYTLYAALSGHDGKAAQFTIK